MTRVINFLIKLQSLYSLGRPGSPVAHKEIGTRFSLEYFDRLGLRVMWMSIVILFICEMSYIAYKVSLALWKFIFHL